MTVALVQGAAILLEAEAWEAKQNVGAMK